MYSQKKKKNEIIENGGIFFEGDFQELFKKHSPTHVILATPIQTLNDLVAKLIKHNVKNLLIEKPFFLNSEDSKLFLKKTQNLNINIFIAFNRRFYSSINFALNLIRDKKEKIESVNFEFNEIIRPQNGPVNQLEDVKQRWLLANSLHVIDTAFFPVGLPDLKKSNFQHKNENLEWHKSTSIFFGSGLTEKGIPFVYHANWNCPGRWSFEWMTRSHRFIFSPLEKLKVMKRNSFQVEELAIDDNLDLRFKAGVYQQNKSFLNNQSDKRLVKMSYLNNLLKVGEKIGNY